MRMRRKVLVVWALMALATTFVARPGRADGHDDHGGRDDDNVTTTRSITVHVQSKLCATCTQSPAVGYWVMWLPTSGGLGLAQEVGERGGTTFSTPNVDAIVCVVVPGCGGPVETYPTLLTFGATGSPSRLSLGPACWSV